MAANFFEHQDLARRNTTRLVILFALAVLAIIASIELLLAATLGYLGRDPQTGAINWAVAVNPQLFVVAAVGTLIVVGGGSLYKIAQLRGGGRVVAEELGGRRLTPDTTVPAERQLLNVVEEMAIASGTPTPPVYLLEREAGINAFAAGFTPNDAVIGVTRGTAEQLTRDELQGVIAHEFSHILNGDMRLNIRLIGLLHGILIIGILGYFLLMMGAFSGYRSRRSRQEGNPLPLLALGAGLMVVGFLGTFFGNLIKAAVSRQREFLADASAVQFTRQPGGIAGALKKIGGLRTGSKVQSPNAPEASHMFFGRATAGLSGLFSTHPPIRERIRRIEPGWDGTLPEVAPQPAGAAAQPSRVAGVAALAGGESVEQSSDAGTAAAIDHIGRPDEAHMRYAASLVGRLPDAVLSAAREPFGARAIVYALLLDHDDGPRQRQLEQLSRAADPAVYEETLRLMPLIGTLDVRARLPLVDIALPALGSLTTAEYQRFTQNVGVLVRADETIDLFEWSLHRILLHDLEPRYVRAAPARVRHRSLAPIQGPCSVLLSSLAYAGHREVGAAQNAFERARQRLGFPVRLLGPTECRLDALDAALTELEHAAPQPKRRILEAAVACITADRTVTATEAELLRVISASLGCPMPPLLGA